jgi:mRNA-degrading endonuclease toxin of MazEF toxin-antitoxin module
MVTVVPVTSNVVTIYPFHILLPAQETHLLVDAEARPDRCVPSRSSVSVPRWAGSRHD